MNAGLARHSMYAAAFSLVLISTGCKKTEAPAPERAAVPKAAAQPAAPTPAPAPSPGGVATAPDATVSDPVLDGGVTVQTTLGDGKSVKWALKQSEIRDDPAGQWAYIATASSAWGDAKNQDRFASWQATGAPNVDQAGDNPNAWAPKTPDGGIEWLDLTYAKPSPATGVRIRESENGGTVIKVDLIDEDSHPHALWSGADPTKALNYFMLTFPKTPYKVSHVKITLATNLVPGDNEIDAVQLVSADN